MKNLLAILAFILLATSCADPILEKTIIDYVHPESWVLVKMTGSFSGSETTGDNMEWQEAYLLNRDNTFSKIRVKDGIKKVETGTYNWIENNNGSKTLELTYPTYNALIGNCTSEPKEYLHLNNDNLLFSSWAACDGPGLYYAFEGSEDTD